jgi:hypothetical protein
LKLALAGTPLLSLGRLHKGKLGVDEPYKLLNLPVNYPDSLTTNHAPNNLALKASVAGLRGAGRPLTNNILANFCGTKSNICHIFGGQITIDTYKKGLCLLVKIKLGIASICSPNMGDDPGEGISQGAPESRVIVGFYQWQQVIERLPVIVVYFLVIINAGKAYLCHKLLFVGKVLIDIAGKRLPEISNGLALFSFAEQDMHLVEHINKFDMLIVNRINPQAKFSIEIE